MSNLHINPKYPLFVFQVRSYMTKKSSDSFDFMKKYNENKPMPLRTMMGFILKESPKMYYVRVRGELVSEKLQKCMCCGRPITHDVSKYFGMGNVCGHHDYTNPFPTKEDLHKAVMKYRTEYLNTLVWEGWLPKSAIESQTPYTPVEFEN